VGLYPGSTLERLTDCASAGLGDAFVGAYLHGSFGGGYADEWSDIDFVVLTTHDVTADEETRLQALHAELYAEGEKPWAQRLEGSYAPVEWFRSLDPELRPFLYLDNGSSQLERDPHCNNAVIRHQVRERSIVLAGPDPKELVAPVDAAVLRDEARAALEDEYAAWFESDGERFSRWAQTYLVLTLCRLLFTARTGAVAGKAEAAVWGERELDPAWASLIRQAFDERGDPSIESGIPADPDKLAATREFVKYALAQR
jgi:predicted nucleotidyltransferase